jgi:hypothetical protein
MNICVTVALDGGVTIELYAKKGKCMHMDICVTVDLFLGVTIELCAKEGKCIHMYICVTVTLLGEGGHRALC